MTLQPRVRYVLSSTDLNDIILLTLLAEYHSAPQTPVELAKVSNKEKVDAAVDRAELDDDHEGAAIAADIETIKNKAQETDEANEFVDDDVIAGGETIAEEAFDA